jgi:hypothetical protein
MKVPKEHEGCKRLGSILDEPVESFEARLEKAAGKKIVFTGSPLGRAIDLVVFEDETVATDRQIFESSEAVANQLRERDERAQRLIDVCPGICQVKVMTGAGQEVQVSVCGMDILEATDAKPAPSSVI